MATSLSHTEAARSSNRRWKGNTSARVPQRVDKMPTSTLHAMINMKLITQLSVEERSPRRSETYITTRRSVRTPVERLARNARSKRRRQMTYEHSARRAMSFNDTCTPSHAWR
eukprot:7386497-Prymnesium_polylepis.1